MTEAAVADRRKKKLKSGRARERGDSQPFTFEMSPAMWGALEACCKAEDRTKRAVIVRALERYLTDAKHWPPPDS